MSQRPMISQVAEWTPDPQNRSGTELFPQAFAFFDVAYTHLSTSANTQKLYSWLLDTLYYTAPASDRPPSISHDAFNHFFSKETFPNIRIIDNLSYHNSSVPTETTWGIVSHEEDPVLGQNIICINAALARGICHDNTTISTRFCHLTFVVIAHELMHALVSYFLPHCKKSPKLDGTPGAGESGWELERWLFKGVLGIQWCPEDPLSVDFLIFEDKVLELSHSADFVQSLSGDTLFDLNSALSMGSAKKVADESLPEGYRRDRGRYQGGCSGTDGVCVGLGLPLLFSGTKETSIRGCVVRRNIQ